MPRRAQVGSPHTWPSLLAAVTWLVELLAYQDKAEAVRQVRAQAGRGYSVEPLAKSLAGLGGQCKGQLC